MSFFSGVKSEGLQESEDRLGGYKPYDTDIYTGKIKVAYAGASAKGARNITLLIDINGKEYRETVYFTNTKGENWYVLKDDPKKKMPMAGFTVIDDICLVTTGSPLESQDVEEKVVKVYDPEQKKEVNKSVPVLVDLLGKEVSLGIVKTLENKTQKQGDEYVAIAETREVNHIEKVFHTESRRTVAEARNGKETAEFWDAWIERNKGTTRDKRTVKDGASSTAGSSGRPGSNTPPVSNNSGTGTPRKSLFGNKTAA